MGIWVNIDQITWIYRSYHESRNFTDLKKEYPRFECESIFFPPSLEVDRRKCPYVDNFFSLRIVSNIKDGPRYDFLPTGGQGDGVHQGGLNRGVIFNMHLKITLLYILWPDSKWNAPLLIKHEGSSAQAIRQLPQTMYLLLEHVTNDRSSWKGLRSLDRFYGLFPTRSDNKIETNQAF